MATRGIGEVSGRNGDVAQRPKAVEQRGVRQLLGCFGIPSGRSESPDHRVKLGVTFMSERLAALEKVLELMRIDACVVKLRPGRLNVQNSAQEEVRGRKKLVASTNQRLSGK